MDSLSASERAAGGRCGAGARARDRALLSIGFFALYALLAQRVFYKTDGIGLVWVARAGGGLVAPHHPLYEPALVALCAVLVPLGVSHYWVAVLFSAAGTAAGVAWAHAGFARLGLTRRDAAWAAVLLGLCPAVLFFATVVEHHGPFFAFACAAFWSMAALVERPTPVRALCLGLLTFVAGVVHATGHLLPAMLLPWFLALRRHRDARRDFGLALLAAAAHLALLLALELWFGRGAGTPSLQLAWLLDHSPRVAMLPRALWSEWLWPFFPLSIAVLACPRSLRRELAALAIGLVPYWLLGWAVLTSSGFDEQGAYALPLAIPAARLALAAAGRARSALAILAFATAILGVVRHERSEDYRAFADDVRAAARGRPCALLVGDASELAACLVELPEQEFLPVSFLQLMSAEHVSARWPEFERRFGEWRDQEREIYLTAGGRRLAALLETRGGGEFLRLLESFYRLEPVDTGSFSAERLVPRASDEHR